MASMRHGYKFLRHLQSKATAAMDIARYSTAVYKQLMEENGHRVVDPPTVQHCQALCTQLFQATNYSSSVVKGLQKAGLLEPQEEAKEMPGNWVVKGLVLAMLTYIGMNVAPMMGENMVRHSVSLVKVEDPFMKRSGASRLTMIATDDEKRKRILDVGGVKAFMGMLKTASNDDTRREALTTLATLAHYDLAVDAMHKAGGLSLANSLSESATTASLQNIALLYLQSWTSGQLTRFRFTMMPRCHVESLCLRKSRGSWLQLEMAQFGKQLLSPNLRTVHVTNCLLHLQPCPHSGPEAS